MIDKAFLKRLEALEKRVEDLKESCFLPVVVIRTDDDLKKYQGEIGPETRVIRIIAAKKRVGASV
ncbi:MAG TPA: hypothetical protein VNM69_18000 [Bacillus sp. (in: firmicutes)]|nr:hypothetical protein [Bacillus sp. (in: firmicutes)]